MNTLMESWPRRHRINVDEYYRMAEVGLLAPDARVELIDGEIIDMVPIGSPHSRAVSHLIRQLGAAIGHGAILRAQDVVRLGRDSEPQPDIALVAPRTDEYGSSHPTSADVLLLVEVSGSSLAYDLEVKVPLYARHGIPELWVVDLQHSQLHAFRSPEGGKYVEHSMTGEPGTMSIAALPGAKVDLGRLLQPGPG